MFSKAEFAAATHRYWNPIMKWYVKPTAGNEDFIEEVFPGTKYNGYIIACGGRIAAFRDFLELEKFEVW
jgi:hypothetical protein